jgi:hypothetical protein
LCARLALSNDIEVPAVRMEELVFALGLVSELGEEVQVQV